ncbi:hypothetical protein B5F18_00835 [Lachnoclostridium sp. An181]|nr:hypothetical protein B5F18_00835 [Lachnoclostridium sp. An181]
MTVITKSIHQFENKIGHCVDYFASRHPIAQALIMLIGVPLFLLIGVSISTMLITLPFAAIFGWL